MITDTRNNGASRYLIFHRHHLRAQLHLELFLSLARISSLHAHIPSIASSGCRRRSRLDPTSARYRRVDGCPFMVVPPVRHAVGPAVCTHMLLCSRLQSPHGRLVPTRRMDPHYLRLRMPVLDSSMVDRLSTGASLTIQAGATQWVIDTWHWSTDDLAITNNYNHPRF